MIELNKAKELYNEAREKEIQRYSEDLEKRIDNLIITFSNSAFHNVGGFDMQLSQSQIDNYVLYHEAMDRVLKKYKDAGYKVVNTKHHKGISW